MTAAGTSLYFEDFAEGQGFVTSGRTVTDADIVLFSGLSGDHTRLHLDEVYARTSSPYGGRVAHGMLGVSIMTGLIAQLGTMHDTAVGLLDISVRFSAPIRIGDTVTARQTVAGKRATSKPDRGIVSFDLELVNQDGVTVCSGKESVMVKRRPESERAAPGG